MSDAEDYAEAMVSACAETWWARITHGRDSPEEKAAIVSHDSLFIAVITDRKLAIRVMTWLSYKAALARNPDLDAALDRRAKDMT